MRLLEETITGAPHALWPRVILSYCLLQEGRDWHAAEQALRNVFDLDLHNGSEAQPLLLQQQSQRG